MKPVDDLESFLDQLRPEVESEGSFTVAFDKARHKLEKYQLEDPWQFPLELLAVSVLGGSDEFCVQTKSNEVVVAFAGESFSLEGLQSIKDHSYTASLSRRHQRLAVALNALQALNPEIVEFQSGQEPDIHIWTSRRGKETVAPSSRNLLLGYSNVLRVQLHSTWSVKASSQPAPDLSGVLKRGLFAPLRLHYNGDSLTPEKQSFGAAWEISHPTVDLNTRWAGAGRFRELDTERPENVPPFGAVLFVADPQDCKFGLRVVLDGVSFRADRKLLGNPYLHCLVTAPSLSIDLSHSSLVVNAEYLRLMNHLKDLGHRAILDLTKTLNQENVPAYWLGLAEATIDHFQKAEDEPATESLEAWIEERRRLLASRGARERARAKERMANVKERELQSKISDPSLEDIGVARVLEKAGRTEEAARLRENLALSSSSDLLRLEAYLARDFAQRLKRALGEYRLSEGWLTALEAYANLEVELEPYQQALAQGDIGMSVTLLRELENYDLLAACLELLTDIASRREAILYRLKALEKDKDNPFLTYLRLETIRLRSRGVVSLVHGIKLSLKASWAYHIASMAGFNTCLSTPLTRGILGLSQPQHYLESELLGLRNARLMDEQTCQFCETGFLFSYRRFSMDDEARALESRLNLQSQLPLLRARLRTELEKLKMRD